MTNKWGREKKREMGGRRTCRLDVAGDGAAVSDVEEVERAGGGRRRRRLHPRRHVRVLHQRLTLQHFPPGRSPSNPSPGSWLVSLILGTNGAADERVGESGNGRRG